MGVEGIRPVVDHRHADWNRRHPIPGDAADPGAAELPGHGQRQRRHRLFDAPAGGPPVGGYAIDAAFNPRSIRVRSPWSCRARGRIGIDREWHVLPADPQPGSQRRAGHGLRHANRVGRFNTADIPRSSDAAVDTVEQSRVARVVTGSAARRPTTRFTRARARARSNLAVASMGMSQSISAMAPVGVTIYVRVVASNAAGSATSNEVAFAVTAPAVPVRRPCRRRRSMAAWSASPGRRPSAGVRRLVMWCWLDCRDRRR